MERALNLNLKNADQESWSFFEIQYRTEYIYDSVKFIGVLGKGFFQGKKWQGCELVEVPLDGGKWTKNLCVSEFTRWTKLKDDCLLVGSPDEKINCLKQIISQFEPNFYHGCSSVFFKNGEANKFESMISEAVRFHKNAWNLNNEIIELYHKKGRKSSGLFEMPSSCEFKLLPHYIPMDFRNSNSVHINPEKYQIKPVAEQMNELLGLLSPIIGYKLKKTTKEITQY